MLKDYSCQQCGCDGEVFFELLEAAKECESLLAELQLGGANNPELDTLRTAIAKADAMWAHVT